MNTPNVDAGRLERRVRRVGRVTVSGIYEFCTFYPFGAIRGGAAIAAYRVIAYAPNQPYELRPYSSLIMIRRKLRSASAAGISGTGSCQ